MNKFTQSRLFLKIVALLLAGGLYVIAATDALDSPRTINTFLPPATTEETVENVPVVANYDSDRYIVSGIPETVTVTLSGSTSRVRLALNRNAFQVVANLSGTPVGEYEVPLQVVGLEQGVTAVVEPEKVTVTIAERGERELPVSLVVQGEESLQTASFVLTESTLDTERAKITGAKEQVNQVATLQAFINVADRQESFQENVVILAFAEDGAQVEGVTIQPEEAIATLSIAEVGTETTSKEVPVQVEQTGTLSDGIFIQRTIVEPEVVRIFGTEETLAGISEITAKLDTSTITEDQTVRIKLTLPNGVEVASPSAVNVKVELETPERRVFTDIPIETRNVPTDLTVSNQNLRVANIAVTAVPSILEGIETKLQLFIDLANLAQGTHEIPLQVEQIPHAEIELDNNEVISVTLITEENT